MQQPAYNDAIGRHRYDARWIAFLDLDEFVVPMRDDSVAAFLKRHEGETAIGINWLIYGSSGHRKRTPGLVIERFTAHSEPGFPDNEIVKSIVDPRAVAYMGTHHAELVAGRKGSPSGRAIRHIKNAPPELGEIRINHYWGKSWEEFRRKKFNGRAEGDCPEIPDDEFRRKDRNEIVGDRVMGKWAPAVERALKNRLKTRAVVVK